VCFLAVGGLCALHHMHLPGCANTKVLRAYGTNSSSNQTGTEHDSFFPSCAPVLDTYSRNSFGTRTVSEVQHACRFLPQVNLTGCVIASLGLQVVYWEGRTP
jgi:hypothetical protein